MDVPLADSARARPFAPRHVAVGRGRTLVVRRVEAGDVDGLEALYAGLDDDSRHRRFFSVYRPRRSFFERMVAVGDRGGAGLVVALEDEAADGEAPGRVVAEASYELLPSGNGELAITVDRAWRGWLGPYLLDALVEAAACDGVPNLEADILVTNGPMLAMFRARGYAAIPNEDWTVVRAMIGVEAPMPTWPAAHDRPRVLVEGAGGHWHAAGAAKASGLDVLGCPGPAGGRNRCPALAGDPCPLVAGADAVVVSHPPEGDSWRALREAHPRLHPGVPICVELAARGGVATRGETVLPAPADDLVAIVHRVAAPGVSAEPADPER